MGRIKRAASFLVSLVLALVILELFFTFVYVIVDGEYIPAKLKLAQRFDPSSGEESNDNCAGSRRLVPHPYLAFVRLQNPVCAEQRPEQSTQPYWQPNTSDEFTILVTGASVPAQLLRLPNRSLKSILENEYRHGNQKITVIDGTNGSWKQPQQLILLLLNLDKIDGFISLEGYNELTNGYFYQYQYSLEAPLFQTYAKANSALLSYRQSVTLFFFRNIFELTQSSLVASNSKTLFFVLDALSRSIADGSGPKEKTSLYQALEEQYRVPPEMSPAMRKELYFGEYRNYLATLKKLCDANQIKHAVFIQPVPVLHKKLTDRESAFITDSAYAADYAEMTSLLTSTAQVGPTVFSLTDTFQSATDTLYADRIHLDPEGRGPGLLNDKIIDIVSRTWGLTRVSAGKP